MSNILTSVFEEALDPETGVKFSRIYLGKRAADAAALLSKMQWSVWCSGVLRCALYGHSILWDTRGVLHAGDHAGKYEVLFSGESDPHVNLTLEQVLSAILGRNW